MRKKPNSGNAPRAYPPMVFWMHGVWHDQAHCSLTSRKGLRSLVISRWCHSALYGCLMHDFLLEVSHGSLARVQVLCWHSGCRALEALRARGSPPSHSILPALNSSVMVQGSGHLAVPGGSTARVGGTRLRGRACRQTGAERGVCEPALELPHGREGLQGKARVRTVLGKSDCTGS